MRKLNSKGFTLIEVLATVVLIAILGLVAVPNVLNTINKSKENSYKILIDDIKIAGKQLFEELEFADSVLYHYNMDGEKTGVISIEEITYDDFLDEINGSLVSFSEHDVYEDSVVSMLVLSAVQTKVTKINLNLQTLVNNGFLSGTNNSSDSENKNKKIILNPKDKTDIGVCQITIAKILSSSVSGDYRDVEYVVYGQQQAGVSCPTTNEYNE